MEGKVSPPLRNFSTRWKKPLVERGESGGIVRRRAFRVFRADRFGGGTIESGSGVPCPATLLLCLVLCHLRSILPSPFACFADADIDVPE